MIATFGGPANSESSVALRPHFAVGLPFRVLLPLTMNGKGTQVNGCSRSALSALPVCNHHATAHVQVTSTKGLPPLYENGCKRQDLRFLREGRGG